MPLSWLILEKTGLALLSSVLLSWLILESVGFGLGIVELYDFECELILGRIGTVELAD